VGVHPPGLRRQRGLVELPGRVDQLAGDIELTRRRIGQKRLGVVPAVKVGEAQRGGRHRGVASRSGSGEAVDGEFGAAAEDGADLWSTLADGGGTPRMTVKSGTSPAVIT
jgi:hypothetical protein